MNAADVTGLPAESTLRILVTGSRVWTDRAAVAAALRWAITTHQPQPTREQVTVVHGAARGADTLAAQVAAGWGVRVEAYPADWGLHGKAAGILRNAEMVAAGADILLAFPLGESRGSRHCAGLAEAAGIRVVDWPAEGPQLLTNATKAVAR